MSDEAIALGILLATLERIAVAVEKLAAEAEKANKPQKNPNHYTYGGE